MGIDKSCGNKFYRRKDENEGNVKEKEKRTKKEKKESKSWENMPKGKYLDNGA
jgi:hypothetical protein